MACFCGLSTVQVLLLVTVDEGSLPLSQGPFQSHNNQLTLARPFSLRLSKCCLLIYVNAWPFECSRFPLRFSERMLDMSHHLLALSYDI